MKRKKVTEPQDLGYERWLLSETEKGADASDWMSMKLGAAILRMLIRQHDAAIKAQGGGRAMSRAITEGGKP